MMLKVLTPDQVESYQRKGLLFPLPALSAPEVEYFRACHDELDHHLGGRPTAVQKGDRHLDVAWADGSVETVAIPSALS